MYIVVVLLWRWTDLEHDIVTSSAAAHLPDRVEAAATSHSTFHKYVYLDYAEPEPDIYGGYGEKNRK